MIMKKTLLITYFFPPAIGGIENYYNNVCSGLDADRVVVLTNNHPEAGEFDASRNYKIIRTEFFAGSIPPRWRQLLPVIRRIIADEGIEQIIFGHFHPFCLLGRKLKLSYFVFCHGTDITGIKNNWWQKYALKRAYRHRLCQKFVANSAYISDQLNLLVRGSAKTEIIYPGIDYDGLNASLDDLAGRKAILGLAKDDIIMLSVGRVEPEKNYAGIIKLMPELLKKIPKLKYVIAGGGSELESLKDLVQSYDLKYNVIFTGPIKDELSAKAAYYQLSHLYITASLKPEGFGISYLEAGATKNAVIASKFGGSAEVVKDGVTGILVDPNSSQEISRAIVKLASDSDLWEAMSKAGQARAKDFDWHSQLEKIKNIIL